MTNDIDKKIQETRIRIGKIVYDSIVDGIDKVKDRMHLFNEPLPDVYVLVPSYLKGHLIAYCESLPVTIGNILVMTSNLYPSPFYNEIIVYHKDYPTLGFDPHIYRIENQ